MMANPHLLLGLALGAVACVSGGWWCLRRLSQLRYLLDTPTSKIRSAAQGYSELYGLLQPLGDVPLQGPLTGMPCLWWRYRIEEYQADGSRRSWRTLESGCSQDWLRLADATGACLIDPRGAEVRPATRQVWQGSQRHPLRSAQGGFLQQLFSTGQRYRYTEERLHAGEPLYAIGDFRSSGGGQPGQDLQSLQGAVIREWKGDFAGLLQRFDTDGSGQLEAPEWQRVRLAAGLEAERRQQQSSAAPVQHRLLKPGEGQPFILSSHGEDELARRFRWQALGGALLCLSGALLLAWLINPRL